MSIEKGELLVSKICHDLANSLTKIALIKENLIDGTCSAEVGIKDLIESIDMLNLYFEFFRNITIQAQHIKNLYSILISICKKNGIDLSMQYNKCQSIEHSYCEENIICGILYILVYHAIRMKSFNKLDVIFACDSKIIIHIPNILKNDLPQDIDDLITMDAILPNATNILAIYIKDIMSKNHYAAYINDSNSKSPDLQNFETTNSVAINIIVYKLM